MSKNKFVYILGPLVRPDDTDLHHAADDMLTALGYNVLGPTLIPEGMATAKAHRIAVAMIDAADAVVVLPGWQRDVNATAEHHLAVCFDKPMVDLGARGLNPPGVAKAWLEYDLGEVLK